MTTSSSRGTNFLFIALSKHKGNLHSLSVSPLRQVSSDQICLDGRRSHPFQNHRQYRVHPDQYEKGRRSDFAVGLFFAFIRNQNYTPPQNTTKIQTRTSFVVDDKSADELITQR